MTTSQVQYRLEWIKHQVRSDQRDQDELNTLEGGD